MDRPPERSLTSFRFHFKQDALQIARSALAAVDPHVLLSQAASRPLVAGLRGDPNLVVVAAGKAAVAMVEGFAEAVASPRRGVGVALRVPRDRMARLTWYKGGHPTPNAGSVRAGRAALLTAASLAPQERLVVLISGGASALLAAPIDGLPLAAKVEATRVLLGAGVPIEELNCVRKHLSAIKGGRLAAAAREPLLTLAISDVSGPAEDDPGVIGSGPTSADPTTYRDALDVVTRAGVTSRFPRAARNVLERGAAGALPETVKPGDPRLRDSMAMVIGGRRDALAGARRAAEALGYRTVVVDEPTRGEARQAGPKLVRIACEQAHGAGPLCLLAAGETTVRVTGSGRGGRNQELALSAAETLKAFGRAALVSVATDGVDGPTDAAGAYADGTTLERASGAGLGPPQTFLDRNDSYAYFDRLGDLVRTGATGTNVGDLQIVLVAGAP